MPASRKATSKSFDLKDFHALLLYLFDSQRPRGVGVDLWRGGCCFFRNNWRERCIQLNRIPGDNDVSFNMFVLEDANSIQVAFMQVMRFILSHTVDAKPGGLLLFALRPASLDPCHTDLEPLAHERVVIDPDSIHETPLFENTWEAEAFEDDEEDEDTLDSDEEESLDDDEDDEEEEDENEDSDDDDEDDGDSNEPEDEEEDGPPLYVGPDSLSSTVSTLAGSSHPFDMSEELSTAER